uniref:Poly(A) polymerase catalytic subunit domain-containing protein n=1 Tax=viral metagenome TaxID=1070528 RepID=A0A6C0HRU1_9ZZZZ
MNQIELLKTAIKEAEKKNNIQLMQRSGAKKIFQIVKTFIQKHKCICYGGTAINNILPKKDQFYNLYDIPDYDFFSKTPMEDAITLSNIYYNYGYQNVESKSGLHSGTYKVFVDYIPVADITYAEGKFFDNLTKDCIKVDGILYAPPNFLRMAMYVELSRPAGDTSRWEKVFTRLELLNKHFPINKNCSLKGEPNHSSYNILLDLFLKDNVVFFGGYALSFYSKYLPINVTQPFDVISTDAKKLSIKCASKLGVKIIEHDEIEGYIGKRYEINIDNVLVANIYEPVACYNYNTITKNGQKINIATTDTMLSFYLMFLYTKHLDTSRIICLCQYLLNLQKLQPKGVLKRFSLNCIGKQKTQRDIFMEKDVIYKKFKNRKNEEIYKETFFKYNPKEKKTRKRPKKGVFDFFKNLL